LHGTVSQDEESVERESRENQRHARYPHQRPVSDLDAGEFSAWLDEIAAALRGERAADVACGDCTACCTSSQFVPIGPDETDALAHIPKELLFPAPRLPSGHVVLGYDEHGCCPMLEDGRCSIYEHRPRTCRTYDCRVFPATRIELTDPAKVRIAKQARRWRFRYPTEGDRDEQKALLDAAGSLDDVADETQRAVRAVQVRAGVTGASRTATGSGSGSAPSTDRR
jgi:Fe-S-cluster containining protein